MHREIIGVEDGRGSKDRGSVMKRRGGVSQAGWSLEQRLKRAGDIARIGENGTEKLGQGANWEIDSLRDAVDRFEEEYLRKILGMSAGLPWSLVSVDKLSTPSSSATESIPPDSVGWPCPFPWSRRHRKRSFRWRP